MPSFDISSEVDEQEMRNAVDQASRELANRFDFKDTNSSIELGPKEITMRSVSQDRLAAVRQVLEEKLAKRKISMKALDYGTVEDAAGGTVRQVANLVAGARYRRRVYRLELRGFCAIRPVPAFVGLRELARPVELVGVEHRMPTRHQDPQLLVRVVRIGCHGRLGDDAGFGACESIHRRCGQWSFHGLHHEG
mgnify:CR=1 FL=1